MTGGGRHAVLSEGGRARRRKELVFLQWSIAVGLVVSIAFWLVVYWANNHP